MSGSGLITVEMRRQKIQQECMQMDEIMQMLRVIYVSLWGQVQYGRVLRRYKQRQLKQSWSDGQFNVEGKLLEDIVTGISKLKEENADSKIYPIATTNNQQHLHNTITINNNNNNLLTTTTFPLIDSQYDFSKKSAHNNTNNNNNKIYNYQNSQLKLKQTLINKLQTKVTKLESKVCELESELMEYKEQSVNLHRLNESKYSKINELKKQLEQQESVIQQQVTVIYELQKTLNQTIIENSAQIQLNHNNDKVLDGLQLYEHQDHNTQQIKYMQQIAIQQGRRQAWRQLIQQLQGQISTITASGGHDQQLTDYKRNKIGIMQREIDNNNGIQQLQLSFNQIGETSFSNLHQLQDQQEISEIHLQLQIQQNSQINNLFNTTNYLQHQSSEEPSFLSNNNRYLQTINTMTLQLTQAYDRINQLQSQLSQNQKHLSITNTLNPQSLTTTPSPYIHKLKNNKNNSFNFNLSFWK